MGCTKEADSSDYQATRQSNPPSAQSSQDATGDPVNVVTGAFTLSEQDLAFSSQRLQLEFTRHYNNQLHDPSSTQNHSPLGPGWTHSLNLHLEAGPESDQKTYVDDHGSRITFDIGGDPPTYIAPPGSLGLSLNKLNDGSFELRQIDGLTAYFDGSGLIQELSRPGPQAASRLRFHRDSTYRLVTVEGVGSRAIHFEYDDDSPLIRAITDHTGRRWIYRYNDSGELAEVCDPAGRIRRYAYRTKEVRITDVVEPEHEDLPSPQTKLLTIRAIEKVFQYFREGDSEPLAEVTNQYTSDRRVYRQTDANGGVTLFDYNRFTRTTCVTDAAGWTTVYSYDEAGNTTKVRRAGGGATEFIFDDRRNLIAEIRPDGGRTEYVDLNEPERLERAQEFGRRAIGNRSAYVTLTSSEIQTGYDQFGNRPLRRDSLGNTTRYYDYTKFGKPRKVELHDGSILSVEYDDQCGLPIRARHQLAPGTTEVLFRIQEWAYDPLGNITRFTEYMETAEQLPTSKRIVAFAYDEHGNHPTSKLSWIENAGEGEAFASEENYKWDDLGRLVASTTQLRQQAKGEPRSITTRFGYDALGRQILRVEPGNVRTCWELDLDGRIVESFTVTEGEWKSDGSVPVGSRLGRTVLSYDSTGRQTSLVEANGAATFWEWDARGYCTRVLKPSGLTTSYVYDRDGNEIVRRLSTGYELRISYDLASRPVLEEDSLGNAVSRKFDGLGRLEEVSESGSGQTAITRYAYSSFGRDITVNYPDKTYERLVYDDGGNIIRRERGGRNDQPQYMEVLEYDAFGRLTGVKSGDPVAPTKQLAIEHDDAVREDRVCDALGNTTSTFYDSEDYPIKKVDAEGRALYFEYDERGRLRRRSSSEGSVESFYEYSAINQLVSAQEGAIKYSWEHDLAGRLTRHEQRVGANTDALVCQYDEAGRLTSKNIGKDWWTRYCYKPDSEHISRIEIPNATLDLVTDVVGRVIEERWHDGGYTRYRYESDGTLVTLESFDEQGDAVFTQHLERDSRRRPIVETREYSNQKAVYKYDYDGLDRLAIVSLLNAESASELFRYEYDDQGNRLKEFRSGTLHATYRYDRANRLLEQQNPAGLRTYAYDRCGNLTQKGDHTFTYDPAQRLRAISHAPGTEHAIEFSYTATDERAVIKWDNDVERILYDGVQEAVSDSSSGRRRTFWGMQVDTLIAIASDDQTPQRAFTDSMGSVIGIGRASERNYYDPFGAPLKNHKTPLTLGFCGKRYDQETGLYFNRARFYDPTAGRFTQPDPKGFIDGANLYLYARGNPINYSDQLGFTSTKSAQGRIANAYDRLQSPEPGLASLKGLKMVHYDAAGHETGRTYFKERTFWNPVPHLEHFNLKGEKTSETYLKHETFWNPIPHLEHYNMRGERTSETYFKESTFWSPISHFEHFKVSGEKTSETYFKEKTFWNPMAHFTHYDLKGHVTGTSYIQQLSWLGD
jgi:RHS repeat-associated protein